MRSCASSPCGALRITFRRSSMGPPTAASISVETARSVDEAITSLSASLVTLEKADTRSPSPASTCGAPPGSPPPPRATRVRVSAPGVRRRLKCRAVRPSTSRAHLALSRRTEIGVRAATTVSMPMEMSASADTFTRLSATSTSSYSATGQQLRKQSLPSSDAHPVPPACVEEEQAKPRVQLQSHAPDASRACIGGVSGTPGIACPSGTSGGPDRAGPSLFTPPASPCEEPG
eukprot:scaffold17198_cov119-Isochrysis_galbana.AAC.10